MCVTICFLHRHIIPPTWGHDYEFTAKNMTTVGQYCLMSGPCMFSRGNRGPWTALQWLWSRLWWCHLNTSCHIDHIDFMQLQWKRMNFLYANITDKWGSAELKLFFFVLHINVRVLQIKYVCHQSKNYNKVSVITRFVADFLFWNALLHAYFGLLNMCPYCVQARPTVGVYTIGINSSMSSIKTL